MSILLLHNALHTTKLEVFCLQPRHNKHTQGKEPEVIKHDTLLHHMHSKKKREKKTSTATGGSRGAGFPSHMMRVTKQSPWKSSLARSLSGGRSVVLVLTITVCGGGFAHSVANNRRHRLSTYSNASSRACSEGCTCSSTYVKKNGWKISKNETN